MVEAMKTERQMLLAGVRRGDFGALAALMDQMAETDPDFVEREWHGHLRRVRTWIGEVENGEARRRVSIAEYGRRVVKSLLLAVNDRTGAGWRLPEMRSMQWRAEPLYSRVCELRDGIIRLARVTDNPKQE